MELPREGVVEGLKSVGQLVQAMRLSQEGSDLFAQLLMQTSQQSVQSPVKVQEISSRYDESYKDLSAIQAEISNGNPIFDSLFGIDGLSSELENSIGLMREKITQEKALASLAEGLLEKQGKSIVLLVSMDPSVARPLFGQPTNVQVVSIDQGKIISSQSYKVADLDELLKGKVETPKDIQSFGVPSTWQLSDGAWSPDGPTAARQIAWFVGKQTHADADAVIFLESSMIGKLTAALETGDAVQRTVLGIQSSPSDMTQLMSGANSSTPVGLSATLSQLIEGLNSSQAVLFSRDEGTAKTAKSLAWDGSVRTPSCPTQFTVEKSCQVMT